MKYFLNILTFFLLFVPALACDSSSFEFIKKSAAAAIREEFEAVLGDLTKFDYILIYPESPQISVVKISADNKITRKYWRLGIPKTQVMAQDFGKRNFFELKKAIDKIFLNYEKGPEKPLDHGHLNLYRKDADNFSWRCVRFMSGLKDPEFKILYKIMIPDEDIPDPKDVEEFLRGIDN